MLKLFIVAFGLLLICSCGQNNDTGKANLARNTADTVEKHIPKYENGEYRLFYTEKTRYENLLNLNTLENGFDSFQIRFWFGYAFSDSGQLVILQKTQNRWQAAVYSTKSNFNKDRTKITSVSKIITSPVPALGWETLARKLSTEKIATPPDMSAIPNYPEIADGDGVVVEVATLKSYSIFSYQEPGLAAKNNVEEAARLEGFIQLMEKELNFSRLRKHTKSPVTMPIESQKVIYGDSIGH